MISPFGRLKGFLSSLKVRTSTLRQWLLQGIVYGVVGTALLILASVLWLTFGNSAPVQMFSLQTSFLGILCPGQELPVVNLVDVEGRTIVFYDISTMDEGGIQNYPNTQWRYWGYPHPVRAVFEQSLPWEAPDLPPGRYSRVIAARGTDGREKPSMVVAIYEIGGNCKQ